MINEINYLVLLSTCLKIIEWRKRPKQLFEWCLNTLSFKARLLTNFKSETKLQLISSDVVIDSYRLFACHWVRQLSLFKVVNKAKIKQSFAKFMAQFIFGFNTILYTTLHYQSYWLLERQQLTISLMRNIILCRRFSLSITSH